MAQAVNMNVLAIREPEYDLTTIDISEMDQVTVMQQDESLVWHTLILSPTMVDTLIQKLTHWKALSDPSTHLHQPRDAVST